jgi:hypothetical protein
VVPFARDSPLEGLLFVKLLIPGWRRDRDSKPEGINWTCELQILRCLRCHFAQESRAALATIAHGYAGREGPLRRFRHNGVELGEA